MLFKFLRNTRRMLEKEKTVAFCKIYGFNFVIAGVPEACLENAEGISSEVLP